MLIDVVIVTNLRYLRIGVIRVFYKCLLTLAAIVGYPYDMLIVIQRIPTCR